MDPSDPPFTPSRREALGAFGALSAAPLFSFDGWYPGRITHVHFQVYPNADTRRHATATSQIAFPQEVTKAVYASPLYAARGQNRSVAGIADDGIFSDGASYQIAKMKGSVEAGYAAKLLVGAAA